MARSSKRRRGGRRPEATSSATPVVAAPAPTGELGGMPPLYTLREVARHLNISRSTLWRMTKAGRVPFTRVGKQIRFDILCVRAALDPHR